QYLLLCRGSGVCSCVGLALLRHLGFGRRSTGFRSGYNFALSRGCCYFFADGDNVRHGCVFVGQVLDLVAVRQVADAENTVESKPGHVDVDMIGDVGREALDFYFAKNLVEDAAFCLYAHGNAEELDADADLEELVERDPLHVDMDELILDGLALPFHDHGLGRGDAGNFDVEDGVVAGLRVEDPRDLLRIDFNGNGIRTRPVKDGGDFSAGANATRGILIELARSRLGYDDFRHLSLSFLYSGTGSSFQRLSPNR